MSDEQEQPQTRECPVCGGRQWWRRPDSPELACQRCHPQPETIEAPLEAPRVVVSGTARIDYPPESGLPPREFAFTSAPQAAETDA